jgi:hypothetical protein
MSHTLSESISFDPSLVVPDILDTDYPTTVPQGVQALGNRTQFLLDQINTSNARADTNEDFTNILRSRAVYSLGTGVPGKLIALTEIFNGAASPSYTGGGNFSASSNRVHVPHTGTYILYFTLPLQPTSTPDDPEVTLYLGESVYRSYRVTNARGDAGTYRTILSVSVPLIISSASTQLISLRMEDAEHMLIPAQGTLDIQRLG